MPALLLQTVSLVVVASGAGEIAGDAGEIGAGVGAVGGVGDVGCTAIGQA